MSARVREIQSTGLPWLVAEDAGAVAGFAYASKWKTRSAYRFSAESSVYIAPERRGDGIGSRLYTALIAELERLGLHTVIGGIALPNDASVRLHEKLGFVKTAHFAEVGFKFGAWVDVGYWQRRL
jgi:phosphinothricin acetyltransferase